MCATYGGVPVSGKRVLACDICKSRNYSVTSAKKSDTRLTVKKFCKRCNGHTLHVETR
ncbi:50S ribosomal protein L33 [Shouchella clausii]|uniref:50S ribosomal protein L33 n=1 Tax=Shouchella clausii TaxID=79880 RepID=UPI003558EAB4